jgi:membrane protein DedA with SNARE-associated domain
LPWPSWSDAIVSDFLVFLESLPPGMLYAMITAFAAIENFFPPVPADTAVALGAFLAGRGLMNAPLVFALTWTANVGSGAAVYLLARRYGPAFFRGPFGRRLLSPHTLERIERQYKRHGTYGIFLARLLPVWRGMIMPFAGIAGLPAPRAIIPLALASAFYYGVLTVSVMAIGTNLDDVVRALGHVNDALLLLAVACVGALALWIVRRMR